MPASSFAVERFSHIDSTNTWLLGAARAGARDRTVAVADFQSAGRGRLTRRWEAPPGSALLCSVLLRVVLDADDRHLATVAVSLAALDACRAAGADAQLKWPNDLVVDDRKLAGVLAETDGTVDDDGTTAFVVGLGVNLTWPGPPEAHGTSIEEVAGSSPARDDVLSSYLDALDGWATALSSDAGRRRIVASYRSSLSTIGRHVRAELATAHVVGVAVDVTDEGLLVVQSATERMAIAAGDVVHLRGAPPGAPEAPE